VDFNNEELTVDQIASVISAEWERGVSAICPTVITAPEEKLLTILSVIAKARRSDPELRRSMPCVHVEGPYLAPNEGARGAHDPEYLRLPNVEELDRWQRAAEGMVGLVTLAPELPGADAYIRAASARAVIIGLGHSVARPVEIRAAVDAGAKMSTHLGNGCCLMLHRHLNPIWAQLAEDALAASFVADGHHLPRDVFNVMVRAKGVRRSLLVSDSVALAGSPPGRYRTPVGGDVELSSDNRLTLSGTGGQLLAGSVSCLTDCLGWAVSRAGLALADAVRMASGNPARLLASRGAGAQDCPEKRGLVVGARANISVFEFDDDTGDLSMQAAVISGNLIGATP
jgi:N-acetylglucosamine-6-phosphate deacetylase